MGSRHEHRKERRIRAAERYSTVSTATVAVLLHESRLWVADLETGEAEALSLTSAQAPCLDPTGHLIAYVRDGALRVVGIDGSDDRPLFEPDHDDVFCGSPECVAWVSMDRDRGFWWSPDGTRLLVTCESTGARRHRWSRFKPATSDSFTYSRLTRTPA